MKQSTILLLVLLSMVNFGVAQNFSQKGIDMNGEAESDYSGHSVSMPDNNTIAIGALYNDGSGNNSGHVRINQWNGTAWVQKGNDLNGEFPDDFSGYSVSMPDANTVAIGAYGNDAAGDYTGHVRIYYWNGSSWLQKGGDINGQAAYDISGCSVSMPDNNTVAIGAFGSGADVGNVRIFTWNGSSWTQKGFDISGEAANDQSGWSVSMPDNNTVAIGAALNDGSATNAGHVRVYNWNGSFWVQKGTDINGQAMEDQFGYSVSMPDINTLAVGAPYHSGNGASAGRVRVYKWNGSTWVQKGQSLDGEAAGDRSGWSLSMPDSNTVAIGAYLNSGSASSAGHVRVYSWNGIAWVQKGVDINGEAASDYSGWSVSMPDNNTVGIGAYQNYGSAPYSGHTRVYAFDCVLSSSSFSVNACNSYTVPSGDETYTFSQTVMDTIPNSLGCDSIMTIVVNINTNSGIDVQSACNSYTWPLNGMTYTFSTNAPTAILTNAAGCDSVVTLNLTIYNSSSSTDVQSACNSYTWPLNNITYTSSTNTPTAMLTNALGCDSVITLNLTITTVNVGISNTSPTLTASASGAGYQWLDCGNNFAVIGGATSQVYYATVNGSYAVAVTQNGCTDTSSCQEVNNVVGLLETSFGSDLRIFPNPTNGELNIDLGTFHNDLRVVVSNTLGQEILKKSYNGVNLVQFNLTGHVGLYFIEVSSGDKKAIIKVMLE